MNVSSQILSVDESPIFVQSVNGFADWFRVVTMLISAAILIMMIWRLYAIWPRYSFAQRMIFLSAGFYNLSIIGRGYTLLVQPTPFNIWQIVTFCGNLCLFTFLIEPKASYSRRFGDDMTKNWRPPKKGI